MQTPTKRNTQASTQTSTTSFTSTLAINQHVHALKKYYATGQTRTYQWRMQQLQQLKKMLLCHEQEFLSALHQDLAKCQQEAWTTEIGITLSEINYTLKQLKRWMKPQKVSSPLIAHPAKSYRLPEPLGTALIIGAWNYPIQLVLGPLIAAIAAGNCCVIKPSELAPASAALIAKRLTHFIDPHAFTVVQGAAEQTAQLLTQPFDHIFYTGGETVGKIVMRAAAEHLTPVTLELGGKCPVIIDHTVNLKIAAKRIAWNKWMNAGQTCLAPDYLLIEKSCAPEFIRLLHSTLQQFYGDDIKNNSDYGRIINTAHFNRLTGYLKNQDIVIGGQHNAATRFIAPTVILNPTTDSPLHTEEIFGPILPIIMLDTIDQAITHINQKPKPLALYAYTKNTTLEEKILHVTSAGNVGINDGMMFMTNHKLPFGGVGNSGMGNYHGKAGFETFSHIKTVMKRATWIDPLLRYPPFSRIKLSLIKKLL